MVPAILYLLFLLPMLSLAARTRVRTPRLTRSDPAPGFKKDALQGEWQTMSDANWTEDDVEQAKRESLEEALDPEFRRKLLREAVVSGLGGYLSYNIHVPKFVHPEDPETYLHADHPAANKNAVFILGPSAVGKTSSVALLMASRAWGLKFPAMKFDGGDWRQTSEVWKKYAQKAGAPRLRDYYDNIYVPSVKQKHTSIFAGWLRDLREKNKLPNTLILPDTAVPCLSKIGGTTPSESTCPVLTKIRMLEDLGYETRFLVVHATFDRCRKGGMQRAWNEGKHYDPCTYGLALASVFKLHHVFGGNETTRKGRFLFMENTFVKDAVPDFFEWNDSQCSETGCNPGFKTRAKQQVREMTKDSCGFAAWWAKLLINA